MNELIISNGTFKHSEKELDFIGIFEEARGYSIFYKDSNNIEFLDDGTEIIEPAYINPLRILLKQNNGFITPAEEMENPFKFYNILTSGEIPEELKYINKIVHYIGFE